MRASFLLICCLFAPLAQAVELRDVRLWDGPESTRVVFDLQGGTAHKFFALENPNRIVIDIADAHQAKGLDLGAAGRGLVKAVRTGPRDGGLRVVLDLDQEVTPKSFGLEPNDNYGHRLIFDLFPKNPAAMPASQDDALVELATVTPSKPAVVAESKSLAKKAEPVRAAPPAPRRSEKPIVIAIDAGHGGEDPGAHGRSGLREKDVTLRIARKLAALVDATPGSTAVLTRKGDYFIPLRGRTAIARTAQADMFI